MAVRRLSVGGPRAVGGRSEGGPDHRVVRNIALNFLHVFLGHGGSPTFWLSAEAVRWSLGPPRRIDGRRTCATISHIATPVRIVKLHVRVLGPRPGTRRHRGCDLRRPRHRAQIRAGNLLERRQADRRAAGLEKRAGRGWKRGGKGGVRMSPRPHPRFPPGVHSKRREVAQSARTLVSQVGSQPRASFTAGASSPAMSRTQCLGLAMICEAELRRRSTRSFHFGRRGVRRRCELGFGPFVTCRPSPRVIVRSASCEAARLRGCDAARQRGLGDDHQQ